MPFIPVIGCIGSYIQREDELLHPLSFFDASGRAHSLGGAASTGFSRSQVLYGVHNNGMPLSIIQEIIGGGGKMNKTMMLSIVSTVVLIGCMFTHQQKLYPFPTNEVTVVGDTIYCSGKPFAKLWTIDPNFPMQDRLFSTNTLYGGGGLAIHYYNNDKDVWIHPEKGISVYQNGKEYTKIEDMQKAWSEIRKEVRDYSNPQNKLPSTHLHIGGRQMEKEDLIRSHVFDVRISNDGKYVSFKSDGILWNSSHKYAVEYGTSQ